MGLFSRWRMMEKAGLARWAEGDLAWFEDNRQSRKFQAEYLNKLSKLRQDLIIQERGNLETAKQRIQKQTVEKTSSPKKDGIRRMKVDNLEDMTSAMNPTRHLKLQQMKMEKIQKRLRPKSPPKFDPLEGKQLLEPIKDDRKCNSAPSDNPQQTFSFNSVFGSDSLPNLSPRSLTEKPKTVIDLQKLLQPTSSIPNVGRRAVKEPDRLLPLQLDARGPHRGFEKNDTFIKQMSMYKKHPRTKLYQGVFHREHLNKESPRQSSIEKFELLPENVQSDADNILLDEVARAQETYANVCPAPACTPVPDEELFTYFDEYNSGVFSVEESSGKCSKGELQVKYRLENDSKDKQNTTEFIKYIKQKRKERVCPKFHTRRKNHEAREKLKDEVSSACHSYNEMSLPKFKQQHGKLPFEALTDSSSPDLEGNSENEKLPILQNNVETLSPRRQLVVQMPDIIFNPASPVKEFDDTSCTGNLMKCSRQNELREREVKSLLEDVKEINEKTTRLKQKMQECNNDSMK